MAKNEMGYVFSPSCRSFLTTGYTSPQYEEERPVSSVVQGMVMLILATDMARHSEILETFKAKVDKFDFASEDHLNSVSREPPELSQCSVETNLFR